VRVRDHTSWLDAASPLSSHHVFAAPSARFIYLLVCLLLLRCHPKHRRHTAQSTTATTPGRLFDCCEIIHLYESYDYMISYPPTSLIVENEHSFRVTSHIMMQYEQLETKDGEWKDFFYFFIYSDGILFPPLFHSNRNLVPP
jgi:hypothetical protein